MCKGEVLYTRYIKRLLRIGLRYITLTSFGCLQSMLNDLYGRIYAQLGEGLAVPLRQSLE